MICGPPSLSYRSGFLHDFPGLDLAVQCLWFVRLKQRGATKEETSKVFENVFLIVYYQENISASNSSSADVQDCPWPAFSSAMAAQVSLLGVKKQLGDVFSRLPSFMACLKGIFRLSFSNSEIWLWGMPRAFAVCLCVIPPLRRSPLSICPQLPGSCSALLAGKESDIIFPPSLWTRSLINFWLSAGIVMCADHFLWAHDLSPRGLVYTI